MTRGSLRSCRNRSAILDGNPGRQRGLRVATLLGTAGRDCLRMSENGTTCRVSGFLGEQAVRTSRASAPDRPAGDGPVPCPSDVLVHWDAILRVGGSEPSSAAPMKTWRFSSSFSRTNRSSPPIPAGQRYRVHPRSCMAVTVREGRYQSVRLSFLNWFEEYLVATASCRGGCLVAASGNTSSLQDATLGAAGAG